MNKSYIKCSEIYVTEKTNCGFTYTDVKPNDPTKISEIRKEYYFIRPTQPVCLELGHENKEHQDGEIFLDVYFNKYMFMPFDINSPISSKDLRMIADKLDELNKDIT